MKPEAVADRGYLEVQDIEVCEAARVIAYVPQRIRSRAVREGFFSKDVFRYEPDRDIFVCGWATALAALPGQVARQYEDRLR